MESASGTSEPESIAPTTPPANASQSEAVDCSDDDDATRSLESVAFFDNVLADKLRHYQELCKKEGTQPSYPSLPSGAQSVSFHPMLNVDSAQAPIQQTTASSSAVNPSEQRELYRKHVLHQYHRFLSLCNQENLLPPNYAMESGTAGIQPPLHLPSTVQPTAQPSNTPATVSVVYSHPTSRSSTAVAPSMQPVDHLAFLSTPPMSSRRSFASSTMVPIEHIQAIRNTPFSVPQSTSFIQNMQPSSASANTSCSVAQEHPQITHPTTILDRECHRIANTIFAKHATAIDSFATSTVSRSIFVTAATTAINAIPCWTPNDDSTDDNTAQQIQLTVAEIQQEKC